MVELQEPTDLSVLLEWDGFGIDDEQAATLGLGWDVALASVERGRPRRRRAARAAPGPAPSAELLPAGRRSVLPRRARRARRRPVELPAGFAVVVVIEGAGTLAGLEVARGDAVLVPHAAGPVERATATSLPLACRRPEGRRA